MGMRIVGICRGSGDQRQRVNRKSADSVRAYANARGWPDIEMIESQSGMALIASDGTPSHLLNTLRPSDVAIVPRLADLADLPAGFRLGVPALLGMGVQLHVAELGGPISQFLEPLQAAWASAVPLERDLADERVRRKEHEQVLAEVLTKFQRDFAADLVRRFGVPADGLPGMTIPNEVVEAFPSQVETSAPVRDPAPIGTYIRLCREALRLTQPQLGSKLNLSASQVSRMESSGASQHIERALELLDPSIFPPPEVRDLMGDLTPYLLAAVKVRLGGSAEGADAAA
jgi:hypothetical protein